MKSQLSLKQLQVISTSLIEYENELPFFHYDTLAEQLKEGHPEDFGFYIALPEPIFGSQDLFVFQDWIQIGSYYGTEEINTEKLPVLEESPEIAKMHYLVHKGISKLVQIKLKVPVREYFSSNEAASK